MEGKRGKHLLRRRGEFLERPFAHQYETCALRRVHVRGRNNVAKRVLIQPAAFNLALIPRSITKAGTPKGLADPNAISFCALWDVVNIILPLFALTTSPIEFDRLIWPPWQLRDDTIPEWTGEAKWNYSKRSG